MGFPYQFSDTLPGGKLKFVNEFSETSLQKCYIKTRDELENFKQYCETSTEKAVRGEPDYYIKYKVNSYFIFN